MALTGHVLEGADLVYAGIFKHRMSPECAGFLESTASKISMHTSSLDGRRLLEEHHLALPDPSAWLQRRQSTLSRCFSLTGQ